MAVCVQIYLFGFVPK